MTAIQKRDPTEEDTMRMRAVATQLVVELSELGAFGPLLGKGGQAAVYDLPSLRLADVPAPLVYKQYLGEHESRDGLLRIVTARHKLDPARRARLDAMTSWPCRVVESEGEVTGIVMPRIPDAYFDRLTLLGSGTSKQVLREVQNLFVAPKLLTHIGRPSPTPEQRLAICRDFAAALAFYHDELHVVFGDINPKNEVYRLDARPTVLFLDCDGVRPRSGVSAARQLNAPDWVPPEPGVLTTATDRYKLGLFILRCLCPGSGMSGRCDPSAAAGVLDATGIRMLRSALSGDPRGRPTAAEWQRYVMKTLGEPVEPPKLVDVATSDFVLAGQQAEVRWTATEAEVIELSMGTCTTRVDGASGRGVVRVPVTELGFLQVRAVNSLGVDTCSVGPIAVVPQPVRLALSVPTPELRWPEVAEVAVPDVVPPRPRAIELPMVNPPALIGAATGAPASFWPGHLSIACPLDIVAMTTSGPLLDFGFRPTGGSS